MIPSIFSASLRVGTMTERLGDSDAMREKIALIRRRQAGRGDIDVLKIRKADSR
jgi:hypothetical protein